MAMVSARKTKTTFRLDIFFLRHDNALKTFRSALELFRERPRYWKGRIIIQLLFEREKSSPITFFWECVVEKCDEWCGRSVNQCRFCQPNFETWRCLSITSIEHKLQSLVWSKVWKAFHAIFCLCYITHQKNIYPIFVCYIPFYQSFHVLYGRVICHLLVAKQRAFKRLDRKHIGPCNHKSHKNVINPTTDEIPERQTV